MTLETFSLAGGPLHRLGCRLRLVRDGINSLPFGVALGGGAWIVLCGLALLEGAGGLLVSMSVIAGHARLLIVIPLPFICESSLDPRLTACVGMLARSGIVTAGARPAFEAAIARTARWNNGWLGETVCILAAVASFEARRLHLFGVTATFDPARNAGGAAWTTFWEWTVCLTLFRFLILRWLWRIDLWALFLWRVSRLELRLVATHPDGVAGLGYLELVHTYFAPLVVALSIVQASSLAEDMAIGAIAFEAIYSALGIIVIVDAVLFIGPLLLFSPALLACRVHGLFDYTEFAERYVSGFDGKWIRGARLPEQELLGCQDIQALSDLSTSINTARGMCLAPVSRRLLTELALPVLPLLLFKYPLTKLAVTFFSRLTGL